MLNNVKRFICVLIILMMAAAAVSGCGAAGQKTAESTTAAADSSSKAESTAAEEKSLENVTLDIVFPGDPQPDQATVTAALEEAMKDEINVKLNYINIPWNDYATKVKVMAVAGEDIDILWTHPELLAQMYTSNSLAALDDAITKYGKDLTANIAADYWPNVMIKGKTYGVPAAQLGTSTGYMQLTVRQDLREKYGLPEIKNYTDLEMFFAAVKKNDLGILPFACSPGTTVIATDMIYTRGLPQGTVIDMKNNKAVLAIDMPGAMDGYKRVRDWYLKEYISKDVLSVKDFRAPFKEGKAAAVQGDIFEYNFNCQALATAPGVKLEFVRFLVTPEAYQEVTTWNFQSIVASSKNIDRAVMFLNWVQKSQDNYDLMTLGVDGKDYVVKDGQIALPDGIDPAKPPYSPYEWIWTNPKYIKDRSTYIKGFSELYRAQDKDVTFKWKGMGFMFDSSPIKSVVATLASIYGEINPALGSGTMDPEKLVSTYREKLEKAGSAQAITEVQKQLEAFLASR